MFSKNIISRLFPALNEGDLSSSDDGYSAKDADQGSQGAIADILPVLAGIASNGDNGSKDDWQGYVPNRADEQGVPTGAYTPDQPDLSSASSIPASETPISIPADDTNVPTARTSLSPHTSAEVETQENAVRQPPRPLTPREAKKKDLDALITQKIVDKNHGIKGRILEGIQNLLAGMAMTYQANPRAGWQEELAGGAGGVGRGIADKTWNEQREHDRKLGTAERDYRIAAGADEAESKLQDADTKRKAEVYNALTARQKVAYDALDDERKEILAQIKDADDFDPNSKDPATLAIMARVADLNKRGLHISILPHKKGDKFTFNVDPTSGHLVIGNTSTGEYHVGKSGPGRGTTVTKADIPYSFFGIDDEKSLDDKASKQIAPEYPNRRVRPQIANALANQQDDKGEYPYRNEDGSFNEAKAIQDGVFDPTTGYESQGSDYEQRKAAARDKIRSVQANRQKLVDEFSSAVMTHKPSSDNPTPKSLHELMSTFKDILDTKDLKKRKETLKYFYDTYLPTIQIR